MTSNSKQSTAALSMSRAALAPSNDLSASAVRGSSLSQRFETSARRETSPELGYGCVDWFIYGADTLAAPASVPLTG
ncbi:MAG TPA: hypothetical protein VN660_09235 [Steroidobacteraceae bacterium]|nr:hypothetical protein [Steroidobacteraceae bacterium]